jgi:hypothetical protein
MEHRMFNVLSFNLVLNTAIFFVIANIYIRPHLDTMKASAILVPILLLHMARHLGLMFLSPGVVAQGMPLEFAVPAAVGDFIAACLAGISLWFMLRNHPVTRPATWLFNIWGTADLILAITLATIYEAERYMGAAYWIPAFWVPALLVTHYLTFVILIKHWHLATHREGRLKQGST